MVDLATKLRLVEFGGLRDTNLSPATPGQQNILNLLATLLVPKEEVLFSNG
jgi:hypothetical protein